MLELKLSTPFKNAPVFYKPETESTMIEPGTWLARDSYRNPRGGRIPDNGRGRFPERNGNLPRMKASSAP
jgi:hypothetical protein